MKINLQIILAAALLLCCLLAGCTTLGFGGKWTETDWQGDKPPDNPYWLDTGKQAKARGYWRGAMSGVEFRSDYYDEEHDEIDTKRTLKSAYRYLKNTGALKALDMEAQRKYQDGDLWFSARTWHIVGLEPVVGVITSQPSNPALNSKQWAGYRLGTRIQHSDELLWFSPDLKIAPRPLTQIGENLLRIELPDGKRMTLSRVEDEWVAQPDAPIQRSSGTITLSIGNGA